MNGNKQMGSSPPSSSFTSDLFGSTESSSASPSSGIFGSIFSPPPEVLGRESLHSKSIEKKQESTSEVWTTKPGAAQDNIARSSGGKNQSLTNKDESHFYQEQKVQPCHLSSSIYYGGQDVYSHPQNTTQGSGCTTFNNDAGEDDSGSASRGNWWQGSLYY